MLAVQIVGLSRLAEKITRHHFLKLEIVDPRHQELNCSREILDVAQQVGDARFRVGLKLDYLRIRRMRSCHGVFSVLLHSRLLPRQRHHLEDCHEVASHQSDLLMPTCVQSGHLEGLRILLV